jgi:hypothetical protein
MYTSIRTRRRGHRPFAPERVRLLFPFTTNPMISRNTSNFHFGSFRQQNVTQTRPFGAKSACRHVGASTPVYSSSNQNFKLHPAHEDDTGDKEATALLTYPFHPSSVHFLSYAYARGGWDCRIHVNQSRPVSGISILLTSKNKITEKAHSLTNRFNNANAMQSGVRFFSKLKVPQDQGRTPRAVPTLS